VRSQVRWWVVQDVYLARKKPEIREEKSEVRSSRVAEKVCLNLSNRGKEKGVVLNEK